MRTIEVDIDVFAAIWSLRREAEANENDVLRRVLIEDWRFFDAAEDEDTQESGSEEKTSKRASTSLSDSGATEMDRIRWVDDVQIALRELGGRAPLARIHTVVERRRRAGGRSVPRTIDAVIRRTLEDHPSDSANFRGDDIFTLSGRGEWALR